MCEKSQFINQIFNDVELNNFNHNLYLIPDDIKKSIYFDYFYPNEPKVVAIKISHSLLEELNSYECKKLDKTNLVPFLKKVIENEMAVKYMYNNYCHHNIYDGKKYNYFKSLYDKIIIKKEKNYENLNEIDDFALSWLVYLYH
jgi:hypothetical protein